MGDLRRSQSDDSLLWSAINDQNGKQEQPSTPKKSKSENIRVICRFRPENKQEKEVGKEQCVTFQSESTVSVTVKKVSQIMSHSVIALLGRKLTLWCFIANNQATKPGDQDTTAEFTFDRIFQPIASQDDVYSEVAELADDTLEGYHCSLIAYGQTGSGKTFSMLGPEPEDPRQNIFGKFSNQ
jgi:hypothetical protein